MSEEDKNLFQTDDPGSSPEQTSAPTETDPGIFLDLGGFPGLNDILSTINSFTLAWTIFYTILFVSDFFFWYVLYTEGGELPRERRGVKSLMVAARMWVTYLFCLFFFWLYIFSQDTGLGFLFGILAIIIYLIKLILGDMMNIIGIVNSLASFLKPFSNDYFQIKGFPENRMILTLGNKLGFVGRIIDSISEIFSGSTPEEWK
jgi:hypothetical protein